MPVCKPNQKSAPSLRLPGTTSRPLPLISYTETSYFRPVPGIACSAAPNASRLCARITNRIWPRFSRRWCWRGEGIAWLPKSSIQTELKNGELVAPVARNGNLEVELRVYRDTSNKNEFIETLWR